MGIFSALGFLGKLIDPIGAIAKSLASAYEQKQNAKTQQAKIAASVEIAGLEAKRSVLIAESRSPINSLVRLALMFPAAAWIWKVMIWDRMLGLGVSDPLGQNLWYYVFMVLGFYFVDSITSRLKR